MSVNGHLQQNLTNDENNYAKVTCQKVDGKFEIEVSPPSPQKETESTQNKGIPAEKEPLSWMFWKKRRYFVVFLLFIAFFNLYATRVDMSMAISIMTDEHNTTDKNGTIHAGRDFEWDDLTQGYILSAFFYGYLITMFPAGLLAPILGGHNLLGIGVGMGCVLTILTPIAANQSLWVLLLNRAVIGAFGGVTFPCNHAIFSKWAPPMERARMNMIAMSGNFLGMVVAFFGSGLIGTSFGWQPIFYFFGVFGVCWWILWAICVKSDPINDKYCSKEEAEFIVMSIGNKSNETKIIHPWKQILKSKPFWGIVAAHFAHNTAFYTVITYFPKYLREMFGMTFSQTGTITGVCYGISGIIAPISGILADRLQQQKLTTTQVRKYFTCFTYLTQIILFTLVANIKHEILTPVLLVLAASIGVFSWSGYMVNFLDLAPKHASVLLGISNTLSTLPGIFCPMLAGYILQNSPASFSPLVRWSLIYYTISFVLFIGGGIYWLTASGELQPWAD